jgi:hypothetical protein
MLNQRRVPLSVSAAQIIYNIRSNRVLCSIHLCPSSALFSSLTSRESDTTKGRLKMNSNLTPENNAVLGEQQGLQDTDQHNRTRFQVAKVDAENEEKETCPLASSATNQQHSYGLDPRYKSLGQLTRDVPPRAEHYRDLSIQHAYRPTLEELHERNIPEKVQ